VRIGVILALATAAGAAEPVLDCPRVDGAPPRVDGRLDDSAWARAAAVSFTSESHVHASYRARWSGPGDLSASVRAVRAGGDLHLAFEVSDDALVHESGRSWWAGDSIEVFLDTDAGDQEDGDRYTDDDFQLFLMPFHPGLRWGVVARGPDVPYPTGGLRGIEIAHRRTEEGYAVEARIPLWNFERLRPDAEGRIGFDVAINDVDTPGADMTESYMTLSGRFELYATPRNFARLALGAAPTYDTAATGAGAPAVDWLGLAVGLSALLLLGFVAHRASRRLARGTRRRTVVTCAALAGCALACALLPAATRAVDDAATLGRMRPALDAAEAAAVGCLDVDTGDPRARAGRVLALLRDGRVRVRPRYRYTTVPLTPAAREGGSGIRYGIRLGPGEVRSFPLDGLRAPARLRCDVSTPDPAQRELADVPAVEARLEFQEGPDLLAAAAAEPAARIAIDLGARAGTPLRALVLRNRLPFRTIVVDSCFGQDDAAWFPLPLAARSPSGVPLDVWRGRPATHLLTVPRGATATVGDVRAGGDRLWLALRTEGAYPRSAYGAPVARIRIHCADGRPGPERILENGRDVEDRLLSSYARDPSGIALQWLDGTRLPVLYTLHAIDVDPGRTIERVEVTDLGVLDTLVLAAATVGRRAMDAPPSGAGLRLRGDHLALREDVRARFEGLGFSVTTPGGTTTSAGPEHEVTARIALPFGDGAEGGLGVHLPRGDLAATILANRSVAGGVAALLLAVAVVVAGAGLLRRARRLRVKMLVALGAATVVPLLFLAVSLTRALHDSAEANLRDATLADLARLRQRVATGRSRARELAVATRDALELVPAHEPDVFARHVGRSREELGAQGAFLRMPLADPPGSTGLLNPSFFDAVAGSGLHYSPWDGLTAVGVARTSAQHRCVVGLPASALLGAAPPADVAFALFGPGGEPLETAGGAPVGPARGRVARLTRTGRPLYEPRAALGGGLHAAAFAPLEEDGRLVGMMGAYRSRAATEREKGAVLRTVLVSAFAALLLVVLAGGTLVDRVTSRLLRVTGAADAIARGDLKSRVPVEAGDEVGQLAASFNTMADALDERMRQLTELHRGLRELTGALDRAEVARAAAALLARATGARHVAVHALEPATDRLEPLHRLGEGAPLGARLPETGPARDAVELLRVLVKEGAVFLPLVAAGRAVGLAVCSPAAVETVDRAFLGATGRQIGIALENARLYHDAVTDEMTGLYTRAFFVRRLKEEVDRAAATDRPLSLLRIVVEDYRKLARTHGIAVAAKTVAESAAAIERVLPRRNMLARGAQPDELLALLVESDANAARLFLDRVAAALLRHSFSALPDEPKPRFAYRSVTYPRDGVAADMLLDTLFETTETWDETALAERPPLSVPPELGAVLGRSATMRSVLEVVARVAPTNATVLLSGETGTGKEVLADLIQANSGRRDAPWVKVNCAAIPDTLVETELFGHERGAFTGADRRHIGRFERAHEGTLFLDEIGDLPLQTQIKLLRVVQERRVTRVGGSKAVEVDVRIIAASNRDLGEAVRRGAFREDLYHRLHVIELRVPPLRERAEDIPDLVERFRGEFNRQHGLEVVAFTPDALDALYNHAWPGNVRELRNVVERSMLMAQGPKVERRDLALPREAARTDRTARVAGLTPRQERILAVARAEGGVTNSDIVQKEGVSSRTALREAQRLVERGLLVRVGRRRGAVYRVPE